MNGELIGPVLVILGVAGTLIVYARVRRMMLQRRWRAMNNDVARRRAINEEQISQISRSPSGRAQR